jgi:predicted amidohydrolase YtcJ
MTGYLFQGGPIHRMTGGAPPGNDVLVTRGDTIAYVGPADGVPQGVREQVRVIDLAGRPLLPGFCDGHLHLVLSAEEHATLGCRGASGIADLQHFVRERAQEVPAGQWITGLGWEGKTIFADEEPSLAPLDAAAPDHFVFLMSKDAHSAWLNSAGLERLLALDRLPAGCTIQRLGGRPTGLVLEDVLELRRRLIPPRSDEQKAALLGPFVRHLLSRGITAVHCNEPLSDVPLVQRHLSRSAERVRVLCNPVFESPEALRQGREIFRTIIPGWLGIGGAKLFVDGSFGSLTAALSEPYSGTDDFGILVLAEEQLHDWVRAIHEVETYGVFHVIGDRALEMVLSVLRRFDWPSGTRHRLEHAQILPRSFSSAPALQDLVFSGQPSHMWGDREIVERHLPPEMGHRRTYAYRTIIDMGGTLIFGSDSPVEDTDVWSGIAAAVTRLEDEHAPPWNAGERLTLHEALAAHTAWPARVHSRYFSTGVLTPGRKADLVVLDSDPFTRDPRTLRDGLRVEMTFLDGEPVWTTLSTEQNSALRV